MTKFYCPSNCKHGDIVNCDVDAKFSDDATFTDEDGCTLCPRFKETTENELPNT